MKLLRENIKGFRNIREAEFLPSTAVTVICGENGQGKTNLLESIFMLTGAKSFRHVKDRELLCQLPSPYTVLYQNFLFIRKLTPSTAAPLSVWIYE